MQPCVSPDRFLLILARANHSFDDKRLINIIMGAWSIFVDGSRIIALLLFLYCSLSINIYAISCLCILLSEYSYKSYCINYFIACTVTFYCLDKEHVTLLSYKAHRATNRNTALPDKIVSKYTAEILEYVLHDAERCLTIEQFEPVKTNTHCVFAKTAKLWGSRDYDASLSLEENTRRSVKVS